MQRHTARRRSHRRLATGITLVLVSVVQLAGAPTFAVQLAVAATVVALLGLPHGALDAVVGLRGLPRRYGLGPTSFAAVYLALAAVPIVAWFLAPTASLVAFLLLSLVHFGRGDLAEPPRRDLATLVEVLARGGVPILLPVAFHPDQVAPLFASLIGDASGLAAALPALAPWAGAVWLGLASATVLGHAGEPGRRTEDSLELGILAGTFAFLPPLLAFAVYFGLWHSLRHLIALDVLLNLRMGLERRRLVGLGLPMLAGSLALFGIGYLALAGSRVDPTRIDTEALVRTLFVGLAALTLPHLVVTSWVDRALAREASPARIPRVRPVRSVRGSQPAARPRSVGSARLILRRPRTS